MQMVFMALIILGAFYWFVQFIFTFQLITRVRTVDKLPYKKLDKWPRVSVIIPARNEAKTIETAMKLRLQSDYPNLEIVLVDDRSNDETLAIMNEIAKNDSRVKVIQIKELPGEWIGKLYAMHIAAEMASGDWLLFSDADVKIAPGTLKRVISFSEMGGYDHIAGIPELFRSGFLVDIVLSVFMRQMCILGRLWKVGDDKSDAAAGAGAFNLVRRSAFNKAQGFSKIKMTVADDVALGRILKESGARCGVFNGRDNVGVCFYHSIREIAIGSERALFTMIGRFSMIRLISLGLLIFILEISPFIALCAIDLPYIFFTGVIMTALLFFVSVTVNIYLGRPWWTACFLPLAVLIMFICTIRAGVLGAKRGGIIWRGTYYATEQLKKFRQ